jgi:tetratricopeptide (TPR) repeat protein
MLLSCAGVEASKAPPTWWIDAGHGLMWTMQTSHSMNYQSAVAYCADLRLAGYSDWRLPTIAELDMVTTNRSYTTTGIHDHKAVEHSDVDVSFAWGKAPPNGYVWSSTSNGKDKMVVENLSFASGGHSDANPTASLLGGGHYALCVRGVTDDKPTPQIRAQAAVLVSQVAARAGNYEPALDYAKQALALDPGSPDALDALGVAEGHLGQWADAVTQIEAALKIDGKNSGYKADLKWAKKGLADTGNK